jgi:SAM-dependent methyltransferase
VTERGNAVYTQAEMVDHYDRANELQPAERVLFETHVAQGARVLDVGVGAGRTTSFLSARASAYVGVDLAEPMVARCRQKFPDLRFEQADATDLAAFESGTFDVVVFSFNGLDCIPSVAGREACYAACARVLRPGGVLLFSSHNAAYLLYPPVLTGGWHRRLWRALYALGHSVSNLVFILPTRAYWRGAGFVRDPATHGGLKHIATRDHVADELQRHGFELLDALPAIHPARTSNLTTAWYYYAARKQDAPARG